jgi:hypothetical protein
MPKYVVRKYENYIVQIPGTNVPKKIYHEGEFVILDDISNDRQAHKLQLVNSESEQKPETSGGSKPAKEFNPPGQNMHGSDKGNFSLFGHKNTAEQAIRSAKEKLK